MMRSEKLAAKRSEKIEQNFSRTSETHAKRFQFHFISLISETIFEAKRAHPTSDPHFKVQ
jgi:hypothetical protein